MKNIGIKISVAAVSVMSFVSASTASIPNQTIPEPGMFGMFAGAIAVIVIMTRIIKRK